MLTIAWGMVMTRVMENSDDKLIEYVDDNGMEHCDENVMGNCDEIGMEPFRYRVQGAF